MEKQEDSQPDPSLDRVERDKEQMVEASPPLDIETPDQSADSAKEWEYITGLKLMVVIAAVTMTAFLVLLDNSIVTTVSQPLHQWYSP